MVSQACVMVGAAGSDSQTRTIFMDAVGVQVSRVFRLLVAALAVATIGLAVASPRRSQGGELSHPGCGTDVWVVSTRRLPGICALPNGANLGVERLDEASNCWVGSDVESLLADTSRPLMVFIHGNRYEAGEAKSQGIRLARRLAACCPEAPPFRTVIFSWPSAQRGILLKDGRAKYDRSFADGHYLAWLLGQVPPDRPVAIVSYSFGAIIALEAFEDLIAANRAGRADIQPWCQRQARTNVVFIAPAVRCDALAPRGPYAETVACIDEFTLVINSDDDALRFFPLLDCRQRAEALGYVGMPSGWLPAEIGFTKTDAAGIIGRNHGLPLYLDSARLSQKICRGASAGLAEPPLP